MQHLVGQLAGTADAPEVRKDQYVFVATDTRQQRVLPFQGTDAGGYLLQEFVAGIMAEAVVDLLEVVEVEEQQRQPVARVGLDW